MKKNNFNPHDRVFKSLLRTSIFARAFLEQHLSEIELQLFDLSTMQLVNASYIHELSNHESHSDVVYKVETQSGDGYITLLFEHQSKAEKLMPFRVLEYSISLMRQHLNQGHKNLPIVLPIVFYHGKQSPYPYSTSILDCFEDPQLAEQYYFQPFRLVDITVIPDEELKQSIITAPLQIIMKHIYDGDLLPIFKELAREHILDENAKLQNGKLFLNVINYVIRVGEISDRKEFEHLLLNQTEEVRRSIMTIWEQHQQDIQKGMQQGMQQGVHLEKQLIAKNLLTMGLLTLEEIAKATDLSIEQLKQLQTQ